MYVCLLCSKVSHNPNDEKYGYCNACHAFTRECAIGPCGGAPEFVAGNIALCRPHAEEINHAHARHRPARGAAGEAAPRL